MLRKFLITAVMFGLSVASAHASDQVGTITSVQQTQSRVFFYLNGTRTTKPGCDCCGRWEINGATADGQAMLSIILTAYALHKQISVSGTGGCVAGSNDTEGLAMVSAPY